MMTTLEPSGPPDQSSEVDVELFTFVERYATNLVRWDLLLYFGRNPNLASTPPVVARRVGRSLKATTKELDDLTYLHVLTRHYTPQKVTYQLARRGAGRNTVIRLAEFAEKKGSLAEPLFRKRPREL